VSPEERMKAMAGVAHKMLHRSNELQQKPFEVNRAAMADLFSSGGVVYSSPLTTYTAANTVPR
jgi:hypothetical protein